MVILTDKEAADYQKKLKILNREIDLLQEENQRLAKICNEYSRHNAKLNNENFYLKHPNLEAKNLPSGYIFYRAIEKLPFKSFV